MKENEKNEKENNNTNFQLVEFKGQKFVSDGHFLAYKEDFETGLMSYAHIFGDRILRHQKQIGKKSEIKFLKNIKVNVKPEAFGNLVNNFFDMGF